jgi:hypothetical protein
MRARNAIILIASLSAVAVFAIAGPLSPPAGPITGTYKTLGDVEPRVAVNATNTPGNVNYSFVISQPGSYYLTGNITGVSGKAGIEIVASNVTLDLCGFALQGVAGSSQGIVAGGAILNTTVRNGTVTGWGGTGVDLGFISGCRGGLIENVHAGSNSTGIHAAATSVVRNCTATSNSVNGFGLTEGTLAECCAARSNGSSGFVLETGSIARSCSANGNASGFSGISTDALISECSAEANTQKGIVVSGPAIIERCMAGHNGGDGIQIAFGSQVLQNNCFGNGTSGSGAGIHVISTSNRLVENHCYSNPRGYDVGSNQCFFARNTASQNTTNWNVTVSGSVILVVNCTTSGTFSGNTGGTALGSTDPNANYTY